MKNFDIPDNYKNSIISHIKEVRKEGDPRKTDFSPTILDFGPVKFLAARHFGFCFGVQNAIEIAYKTINGNPGKNIFFLSEMIHNPVVNSDLKEAGIRFIMDNYGSQLIPWSEIMPDDIVIIPAFGTTIEIEAMLKKKGIDTVKFNTTCPFVEKVWNKADALGKQNFTVVIHGKYEHEETRATFSHTVQNSPAVIIRNFDEAVFLSKIISGEIENTRFYEFFAGKYSHGFDVEKDLEKIGVVNQTTMLASETDAIAGLLKGCMLHKYGVDNAGEHFADTRDTLCYATNDNQQSAHALLEHDAELAIVIGGYNSSNTTHLVELLEKKFNTFFISGADKIISSKEISHFDIHSKMEIVTPTSFYYGDVLTIAVTSGASCPDSIVNDVLLKILSFFPTAKKIEQLF
jgi:4-hydroxy-3-methylbut-2-en-1-yl diphosphate reductase